MTTDKTIFGLRYKSNDQLLPAQKELKGFLGSPKRAGTPERHDDDLAAYRKLLADVRAYELLRQNGAAQVDLGDEIFYRVLAHSHFVNPALLSAVEQYKYHFHALTGLDFKKPTTFIKSAEQEMARLNPKKKDDSARLLRFQEMVDERRQVLEALTRRWAALVEELVYIVQYLRDNLGKIEKLCEASIVILIREQIDRKKELVLIEDIKMHIKDRLRESLRQGTITRNHLEAAKEEVIELSKRTADVLRSDVFTLTGLYETIYEHAKKIVRELDALVAHIAAKRTDPEDDKTAFAEIERVLISLVMDYRFKLPSSEIREKTEHDMIIHEKRKEMYAHLLDLLQN